MIEEFNQIGNINSVNDFLDFKLSIKTIVLLCFLGGFAFIIFKDINNIPRICTPFADKKDTPIKNSKFSNILLTLIFINF